MIDFGSLIGQAQDAIHSGVQQIEAQGVPAITAAAENWGANVLQDQAKQNQAALNLAVAKAPPAAPGSFASYLQGTIANTLTHNKGPTLVIGALAVVLVGYYLLKKA